MDDVFKRKLLSLRNPPPVKTFAEALLGDSSWAKPQEKISRPAPTVMEDYSEKRQVIESLERFAQEKVEGQASPVIAFDGGEVQVKTEPGWEGLSHFTDLPSLLSSLSLEKELKELVVAPKRRGEVKVIFVSEKFRRWDEVSSELKSGFINEIMAGFPLKTSELFLRMIAAMKLDQSEVIIYPVEGGAEEDYASEVMEIAAFFRPEVIITLGAKSTQRILKSNDRLSLVHGQFFTRKLGSQAAVQVVPLFHPSIIESNQNMKKTAWADMQKIMKHLKKLP